MTDHAAEGISVLLPVFNQAGTIDQAAAAWSVLLERLERPYEMLIIDDGSTDATVKQLDGLSARIPQLRVLTHSQRRGFGASIRTALEVSRLPLVFYTGCDFAYNPADLRKLLHRIEEVDPETEKKIDVVNGYRGGTPLPAGAQWRSRLWRGFLRVALGMSVPPSAGWLGEREHRFARRIRAVFGVRIGDVNSRFKLFRKNIFKRIPIQSDGDFVHAEILAKANFLGCLMDEVPIGERPGTFPAHTEPPSPVPIGKELRRIFSHPDFGPTAVVAPQSVPC